MFDYIDKHKRLAQVVLGIIGMTFVFFGTYSYFQKSSEAPEVASVDGDKVTQRDFDELLREQQDRMRQSLGKNYDPAMFDSPEVRFAMVDQLVNQKLLEREARAEKLRVTDGQLTQFIAALPPFQEDGKFSPDRYKLVLSGQNMTPQMFEQKLRNDLTLAPLQEPIASANFVAGASAQRYLSLLEQKREVASATIDAEPFTRDVKIDDAAIKEFYDKNKNALQTPEQARIEYIVLSPETLTSKVSIKADEVKAHYEQNLRQYGAPEERAAAHILVSVTPDASDADKAAAKKKADEIAAKVRANPADFAKLAKDNSQDPGSAAAGGDLGSFTHDSMVKPFADAVFAAKTGDIVGPVLSDFGYHVIKVGAIKPAQAKPFDTVKADIEAEMKRAKAQQLFADDAEKFQNLVYEQADSLAGAGKALDVKVTETPFVTRAQVQQIAKDNPKFVTALFAPESIAAKRNTDAIEVAPNTLVAGRIVEYKAAATRPLDEVKDEIRRQLTRREAAALAQKAGLARIAALNAGKSDKEAAVVFSKPIELLRTQVGPAMPPDALIKVFQADAKKLPAYVGTTNANGGYVIYRVSKVIEPEKLDDARLKIAGARMGDQIGRELLTAYLAGLKSRASVTINQAALEPKPAQP
ncbi:MAG: SurA N-terminal domain-containing protein [Betaproteobacteria bacterium]